MKKIIFVILLIISLYSFIYESSKLQNGLSKGKYIPIETRKHFHLDQIEKEYFLINFWNMENVSSRLINNLLYHELSTDSCKIKFISCYVNYSGGGVREMIKMDGINDSTILYIDKNNNSSIYDSFKLNKGCSNYLITKTGQIVATNIEYRNYKTLLQEFLN